MRTEQNIYALIFVFLLVLFGLQSLLFLVLPFSTALQGSLAAFFMQPPWYVGYIAVFALLLFFLLLTISWAMHKKRYVRMTMECDKVSIEKGVIEEYVHRYFQKEMPGKDPVYDIILGKENSLDIVLELHDFSLHEKEGFFSKVQFELGSLLARKIGYERPFTLTVVEK